MKLFIIFFTFTVVHAVSIFEFPGDDFILEVSEGAKLCGIKYAGPISSIHKTISECMELGVNIEETINLLKEKLKNKKEIIFAFYNENSTFRPGIKAGGKEWKLAGIVYNYKENLYRLEVYDLEGKYYYFEKDISAIKLVIKK